MPLAIPQNYRWVLVSGRRHEAVPLFLKVYPKLHHIWVHNCYLPFTLGYSFSKSNLEHRENVAVVCLVYIIVAQQQSVKVCIFNLFKDSLSPEH